MNQRIKERLRKLPEMFTWFLATFEITKDVFNYVYAKPVMSVYQPYFLATVLTVVLSVRFYFDKKRA